MGSVDIGLVILIFQNIGLVRLQSIMVYLCRLSRISDSVFWYILLPSSCITMAISGRLICIFSPLPFGINRITIAVESILSFSIALGRHINSSIAIISQLGSRCLKSKSWPIYDAFLPLHKADKSVDFPDWGPPIITIMGVGRCMLMFSVF